MKNKKFMAIISIKIIFSESLVAMELSGGGGGSLSRRFTKPTKTGH